MERHSAITRTKVLQLQFPRKRYKLWPSPSEFILTERLRRFGISILGWGGFHWEFDRSVKASRYRGCSVTLASEATSSIERCQQGVDVDFKPKKPISKSVRSDSRLLSSKPPTFAKCEVYTHKDEALGPDRILGIGVRRVCREGLKTVLTVTKHAMAQMLLGKSNSLIPATC